ncbi:hypothetical protein R80B4_00141 [Fibrobacteres bacterium R8-0-B4]
MARMTEEEAFDLDEKWTKTTPKVGPNGSGFIAKRKATATHTITIDETSADYLFAKAIAEHKTPAEVISDMVHEKLAVATTG